MILIKNEKILGGEWVGRNAGEDRSSRRPLGTCWNPRPQAERCLQCQQTAGGMTAPSLQALLLTP